MRMSDSVPCAWKSRKAVCAVAYTVQDAASCLCELEVKAVLFSSHVMVVSNDLGIAQGLGKSRDLSTIQSAVWSCSLS